MIDYLFFLSVFTDIMSHAHLVGWVRENWLNHANTVECSAESDSPGHIDPDPCRTVILHFDHMRSRTSYLKTIANWTSELGISGRLTFCDRLIIGFMQGTASDIKVGFYSSWF